MMTSKQTTVVDRRLGLRAVGVALAMVAVSSTSFGQTFTSGSDGSDGALNLPTGSGIVIFDPFDENRWGKVLDPDGDGVYNFTTITIAAGTTLKLRGDKVNRPVYWLASGDVVISGTVDLSGGAGTRASADVNARRILAVPGSGGYAGGAGGRTTPLLAETPGEGPGGGTGGVGFVCDGFFSVCGRGAMFAGNRFLVPLVGGSGGEGARTNSGMSQFVGQGGGAGGGAILIASSTSIMVNGTITAKGGNSGEWVDNAAKLAGGGGGGSIRLVAPIQSGGGTLSVSGGQASGASLSLGASGIVRLETYQDGAPFTTVGEVIRGAPGHPGTLRPATSIRITAIDDVPVAANPTGVFRVPADATISADRPVDVDIEAKGTVPAKSVE
jgi:hypothetical protein